VRDFTSVSQAPWLKSRALIRTYPPASAALRQKSHYQ
jgi:hypothetical protein